MKPRVRPATRRRGPHALWQLIARVLALSLIPLGAALVAAPARAVTTTNTPLVTMRLATWNMDQPYTANTNGIWSNQVALVAADNDVVMLQNPGQSPPTDGTYTPINTQITPGGGPVVSYGEWRPVGSTQTFYVYFANTAPTYTNANTLYNLAIVSTTPATAVNSLQAVHNPANGSQPAIGVLIDGTWLWNINTVLFNPTMYTDATVLLNLMAINAGGYPVAALGAYGSGVPQSPAWQHVGTHNTQWGQQLDNWQYMMTNGDVTAPSGSVYQAQPIETGYTYNVVEFHQVDLHQSDSDGITVSSAMGNGDTVLETAGGNPNDGATSDINTEQNTGNQTFSTVENADGTVTFENRQSHKCLDLVGGLSAGQGALVDQWSCQGQRSQDWLVYPSYTQDYNAQISNASNGLCLDVQNEGSAPGTAVDVWPCKANGGLPGSPNQLWNIEQNPNSLGSTDYADAADIEPVGGSVSAQGYTPGSTFVFETTVTNTGTTTWTAGPAGAANTVALGIHVVPIPGGPISTFLSDVHTPLPYNVAPGQSVTLTTDVTMPNVSDGWYFFEAEMVNEGNFWFGQWRDSTIHIYE